VSDKSRIEWTDASWNPVTGCTQVSPGCANCYAKALTERFNGPGSFDTVVLHPERLDTPLHWRKPRRIFVNSMSDLFHEDIPMDFLANIWEVMEKTPQHTYQILTKRAEIMRRRVGGTAGMAWAFDVLPNVWLGVSAENQRWFDQRWPILEATPAALRFISYEPALGPLLLGDARPGWVICGAESGPKRRPFNLAWARELRDECWAAGVPFFMKQGSAFRPGQPSGDPELDECKSFPTLKAQEEG